VILSSSAPNYRVNGGSPSLDDSGGVFLEDLNAGMSYIKILYFFWSAVSRVTFVPAVCHCNHLSSHLHARIIETGLVPNI